MTIQRIDDLDCNANGYPVGVEYGAVYAAMSGTGPTFIAPSIDWVESANIMEAALPAVGAPNPYHWLINPAPGPIWRGLGDDFTPYPWYDFFSYAHVLTDGLTPKPTKPSWRVNPPAQVIAAGFLADTTNRSGLTTTLHLMADLAAARGMKYFQYMGRLDTPDSMRLAESDPVAWAQQADAAIEYMRDNVGVTAIAVDASASYGGHSRRDTGINAVSAEVNQVFENWIGKAARRRESDPSYPLICLETWPETAVRGSSPRKGNRLFSPQATRREYGIVSYMNRGDAESQVLDSNLEWTSPRRHHRFFAVETESTGPGSPPPNPALVRKIAKAGGVYCFGHFGLANFTAVLSPRQAVVPAIDDRSDRAKKPYPPTTPAFRGR